MSTDMIANTVYNIWKVSNAAVRGLADTFLISSDANHFRIFDKRN